MWRCSFSSDVFTVVITVDAGNFHNPEGNKCGLSGNITPLLFTLWPLRKVCGY